MAMNQQAAYEFLIDLKKELSSAYRYGEKEDSPEGARYIKMSNILVKA